MTAHPDLGALLGDPTRAADVPVDSIPNLLHELRAERSRLDALQDTLVARLVVAAPRGKDGRGDRVLTVDDAAAKLNQTPDWLARHGRRLGLTVQLNGPGSKVGYSERACDRLIVNALHPSR